MRLPKATLRALCIDDDEDCRSVTAKLFTRLGGHVVETAGNGEDGIIKALEFEPDIILLDLNMPGMNGFEVMDALYAEEATRNIPVVMITGASLSEDEYAMLKLKRNFKMLATKPADFRALLRKVNGICRSEAAYKKPGRRFFDNCAEPA